MKVLNLFLTAATLFISLSGVANGDPVTRYSSINRVGNPDPLALPEVKIESEKIMIGHIDGYNCFDITYMMRNTSDSAIHEIDYGFPIDYSVIDEQETYSMIDDYYSESSYEVGWNKMLIKDISFSLDGRPLDFEVAKSSVLGLGTEMLDIDDHGDTIWCDGINRRWFYTRFSLPADTVVELNVKYKVYANFFSPRYQNMRFQRHPLEYEFYNFPTSYLDRYFTGGFSIYYDFTPAKYFGEGQKFPIDLEIDLSNLINPVLYDYELNSFVSASIIKKRIEFRDNEKQQISDRFYFENDNCQNVIEKFLINPSDYLVSTLDGITTIEFNRPTFVSDLVCEVDNPRLRAIVGQIVYNDGKVATYTYQRNENSNAWPKCLEPNIVLVINDIDLENSYYYNQKEETVYPQSNSAVRYIRLFHGDSSLRDLRLLDARFAVP